MLKVSRQPDGRPEIFHSIQGEGANIGKPAIFLRLGLCNLACSWCDTKYTWDWGRYDRQKQIMVMSRDEIEREILRYGCRYLIVTGGEPMIQQRQLIPLVESLKSKDLCIEVETNGTIAPTAELANLIDHWIVSPKLGSSGNPPSSREVPEVYEFFSTLPSSQFKYVVQNEDDFVEVQGIIRKYNLAAERIILMPEASDRGILLERSRWLVELCKAEGYLFSTRLQILLWDNRRGI